MRKVSLLLLFIVGVVIWSGSATAQVAFQPDGCEFRVWFVAKPKLTEMKVPSADGVMVDTSVAELNPILDDGNAHYFRAECTNISVFYKTSEEIVEEMNTLAQLNHLKGAKSWVENLPGGMTVGRLRASIDSGQRVYFFDIRRYFGKTSLFDVWAGAEEFPTEGIQMFFKSVAYNGRFLHN